MPSTTHCFACGHRKDLVEMRYCRRCRAIYNRNHRSRVQDSARDPVGRQRERQAWHAWNTIEPGG